MLDKALNTMLKRVSARQNLSVRENSKALTVAVSVYSRGSLDTRSPSAPSYG